MVVMVLMVLMVMIDECKLPGLWIWHYILALWQQRTPRTRARLGPENYITWIGKRVNYGRTDRRPPPATVV